MFFLNGLVFQKLIENRLILRTCSLGDFEFCVEKIMKKPVESRFVALLLSVVKKIFEAYNPEYAIGEVVNCKNINWRNKYVKGNKTR